MMSENTFDKPDRTLTRRMLTFALASAGALAPSMALGQERVLRGLVRAIDIARRLERMNLSEDEEIELGEGLYGPLIADSGGRYRNAAVQDAVARIAAPIFELSARPRFAWDIAVLDNNEVNAWSLPGGKLGVNKGLLRYAASEDELAAVLAHEVGHAELSHVKREMRKKGFYGELSNAATNAAVNAIDDNRIDAALGALQGPMFRLVTSGYSRESEAEADLHIVSVFAQTGRDVASGVGFFNTLLELAPRQSKRTTSLFSGHPETRSRIENILAAADAAAAGAAAVASPPPSESFETVKRVFPTRRHYLRQPIEAAVETE